MCAYIKKNRFFYKHKLIKLDYGYEVVWFRNYGTKDQEIKTKGFVFLKGAETFIDFKINYLKTNNII